MVASLFYSSRKITVRCKKIFVDYRINYQKLCYQMRQITKDLNSANENKGPLIVSIKIRICTEKGTS